jgi:hypothetical protein
MNTWLPIGLDSNYDTLLYFLGLPLRNDPQYEGPISSVYVNRPRHLSSYTIESKTSLTTLHETNLHDSPLLLTRESHTSYCFALVRP